MYDIALKLQEKENTKAADVLFDKFDTDQSNTISFNEAKKVA